MRQKRFVKNYKSLQHSNSPFFNAFVAIFSRKALKQSSTVLCPTLKGKKSCCVAFIYVFLDIFFQVAWFWRMSRIGYTTEYYCDNHDNIRIQSHSSVLLTLWNLMLDIKELCLFKFHIGNVCSCQIISPFLCDSCPCWGRLQSPEQTQPLE